MAEITTKEQQLRALREARFKRRRGVTPVTPVTPVPSQPVTKPASQPDRERQLMAEIAMLQAEVARLKRQLAETHQVSKQPAVTGAERMRQMRARKKHG